MNVDVVLTLDDNYAQHCAVVMASVYENNKQHDITIHILGVGLTGKSKDKLRETTDGFNQKIVFYDLDSSLFDIFTFDTRTL